MKIKVGDKEFKVAVLNTPEAKQQGLKGIPELTKGAGALLTFDPPEDVPITMVGVNIPLGLIFAAEGMVHSLSTAAPNQEGDIIAGRPSDMVLEINAEEMEGLRVANKIELVGVKEEGGTIKYTDGAVKAEGGSLHLLDEDGKVQKNLKGEERVFSRKDTKRLVELAGRAKKSGEDKDYIKLGAKFVEIINRQDTQKPEYVAE